MTQNACPECGSAMEEGFIPDMTWGGVLPSAWHPGQPQRAWLTGVKYKAEQIVPLTAYRCTKCGLLKLYAIRPANDSDAPSDQ
jgi:DNA-directed RNA polymerase subunit RPC12/RpoP